MVLASAAPVVSAPPPRGGGRGALLPVPARVLELLFAALLRCRYCRAGERCAICRAALAELVAGGAA